MKHQSIENYDFSDRGSLLHYYIHILVVLIGIIKLDQVLVSCQSFQNFNFPSDILYSNGCCHLTKQTAVADVNKVFI